MNIMIKECGEKIPYEALHKVYFAAHMNNSVVEFNNTDISEDEIKAKIANDGALFVAVDENTGDVVGTITLSVEPFDKWYAKPKAAVLRLVAVHPDFSGNGIAGRLVSACVEWAKKYQIPVLMWTTAENNQAALHTAKKYHFVIVDYFWFNNIKHPSIRMVRWLNEKPNTIKMNAFYYFRRIKVKLKNIVR